MAIPSHLLGPFTLAHRLFLIYLPAAFGAFILAGALRPERQARRQITKKKKEVGMSEKADDQAEPRGRTIRPGLRKTAAVALLCFLVGALLWPALSSAQVVIQPTRARISVDPIAELPVETFAQIRHRRMELVNSEIIRGMVSTSREDSLAAFSMAVDTAYALLLANSDSPDAHYLLAAALGQRLELSGTREKIRLGGIVRQEAEAAVALDPNHPGGHHVLGRLNAAAMRLGRIERFIARRLLGAKSLDGASWEKAEYHFKRAAELLPGDPLNWLELGALYVDTRRENEALAVLRQATRAPGSDPVRLRGQERALGMICSLDPKECPHVDLDSG